MPTASAHQCILRRLNRGLLAMAAMLALAVATMAQPAASPPEATASAWVETDHGAVRLMSAVEGVGNGQRLSLGLHFRMRPGWKVYWRTPGDAGFPPRLDWGGSNNLATAEILWPAPKRFSVLGFETAGYEDEVVLPIDVTLLEPGLPLAVRLHVDYLTCADICVPYAAALALDVASGPAQPGPWAALIGDFLAKVPAADGPIAVDGFGLVEDGERPALLLRAHRQTPFVQPDVFVEGEPAWAFGAPRVVLSEGGRQAALTVPMLPAVSGQTPALPVTLRVSLVDGDRGVERVVTVRTVDPSPGGVTQGAVAPPQSDHGLGWILALALLGGLILNLMPCVLPVLSIKLMSVVNLDPGRRGSIRQGFLASALGILTSFLVLAAVLALLKAGGTAVGWGMQFQSPWFLVTMTLVVTLFACNLLGLFEVPLPAMIADAGERIGHVRGLGGQFLTGALATLLATPCSAPFVGTALGFALARGPGEILAVFVALGLGLALPYLAVAAMPALAMRLPRSGRWMGALRLVLGLTLMLTAAWLIRVQAAQSGAWVAVVVAGLMLALFLALAIRRWLAPRRRWMASAAAVLLAGAAYLPLASPQLASPQLALPQQAAPGGAGEWVALQPSSIAGLVADGRIVFVTVTAQWCITCKVNETTVLARAAVRERLGRPGVVAMRGDWTRPNAEISRYLAGFGRYGIPFDAVYGPGLPEGLPLPELLTVESVTAALDRAGNSADRQARIDHR